MSISIRIVISLAIGVTAFLILSFMASSYVSGGEQTLVGWLP